MRTRIAAMVAAGVTCAAVVALAGPARADLVTRCVGEGGPVTVPTDLLVPAGQDCVLTGTTVQGDVRVAAGADLVVTHGTLAGRVIVAGNGYLDTTDTTVVGRVTLVGAYGASLVGSKLPGGVMARPGSGSAADGFVSATGSLLGRVVARVGAVELDDSQVAGNLTAAGGMYTDLYGSFVNGRVQVTGNSLGAVACGSAVHGAATYQGNQDVVQLGGDGPVVTCDAANHWGGDVRVRDTTGGVFVDLAIIGGDLTLSGNDPAAQVGSSVLVGGQLVGADRAPLHQNARAPQPTTRRAAGLADRATQRRQRAVEAAHAAGPANL